MSKVPAGYKQTEVGVIPEEWECVSSSRAATFQGGYSFSSKSSASQGIRWLKISNVGIQFADWSDESFLPTAFLKTHASYQLFDGDVVMALTRPILSNKLKITKLVDADVPALLNQRVARIVPTKKGEILFLFQVFQTSQFIQSMLDAMAGSDPPNIGTHTLAKIQIPLPPLPEQKRIAQVLGDVDALIQKLEELIAKKRDIKRAAMQELLTGKRRLPGFSGPWETKKLGEVCTLNKNGIMPPLFPNRVFIHFSLPAYDENRSPVIETGRSIESGKFYVLPDSILLSKLNPRIPRVWVPDSIPQDSICSTEFLVLVPQIGVSRIFLKYILFLPSVQSQLELNAVGTTGSHKRVQPPQAMKITFRIPSDIPEQLAIAQVFSDIDNELIQLETRLAKNNGLKAGLMQQLLMGKIRLVEAP